MLTITQRCWLCKIPAEITFGYVYKYLERKICDKCYTLLFKVEQAESLRAVVHSIENPVFLTLKEIERDAIEAALMQGLNITDSAKALGITRATMYAKMREYDITRDGSSVPGDDT